MSHQLLKSPTTGSGSPPPVTPLIHAITSIPNSPISVPGITSTHLSCLVFASLLRSSPRAKNLARSIVPQLPSAQSSTGSFFVPADGGPPPAEPEKTPEDDEPPQTLLQILAEHLSLSFLSRTRADTSDQEAREWDRLIVGYLCLLIQWLWEDAHAVRDFLEAGALGMVCFFPFCSSG